MRRFPLVLFVLLAALAALVATGCGGGGGSSASGIASVVPADAGVYFDVAARPDAPGAAGLGDAVGKVTGRQIDLEVEFATALDQALSSSGSNLTYEKDIKPLLGDRAGGFVSVVNDAVEGAFMVQVTDGGKALDTISQLIESSGSGTTLQDRSYNGVDYKTDGKAAVAIVDGNLVVGTVHGLEASVDASKGDSLADSKDFQDAAGDKSNQDLAVAYATPAGVIDLLAQGGKVPAVALDAVKQRLGAQGDKPVVVSASVDSGGFKLQGSGPATGSGAQASLEDLPAQSWAAVGFVGAGEALKRALAQAQAGSPLDLNSLLLHRSGLDLNADVLGWLGDFSAFLGGSSVIDLKLGAVITSTDAQASAQALDRLRILVAGNLPPGRAKVGKLGVTGDAGFTVTFPGFPAPLNVVQRGSKVVVALGDETTNQAFSSAAAGLGSSADFERAKQGLGAGFAPSAYIAFPAMARFLESLPNAQSDPNISMVLPYLKRLDFFAAGAKHEGDRASFSAALGLP